MTLEEQYAYALDELLRGDPVYAPIAFGCNLIRLARFAGLDVRAEQTGDSLVVYRAPDQSGPHVCAVFGTKGMFVPRCLTCGWSAPGQATCDEAEHTALYEHLLPVAQRTRDRFITRHLN